jgi:hypothetical protein
LNKPPAWRLFGFFEDFPFIVVADVLETTFQKLACFFKGPGNFNDIVLLAEIYELSVTHCVFDTLFAELSKK